jgi:hypothetical protein
MTNLPTARFPNFPPGDRILSLKQAAYASEKSPDTAARWARRFGIGRQIERHSAWAISQTGLLIVMSGDRPALDAFRSQDWRSPVLVPYLDTQQQQGAA